MPALTIDDAGRVPPGEEAWLWHTPRWRAEAAGWVADQLNELDIVPTGNLEQIYSRPYATIMRLATTQGDLWFKANGPGYRREAATLQEMGRWSRGRTAPLLAAEVDRGWFLTADAGPSMESVLARDPDLGHWEWVLREYAALQVESADHVTALLSLGVPDKTPAAMPAALEEILSRPQGLVGPEPGLSGEEYHALCASVDEFRTLCTDLARIGMANTIQHDDLTPANILMPRSHPVFIDWTDACIAHPFASLTYPVRHVMDRFSVGIDSREVRRVKDAYFEPWTGQHDKATLDVGADLAVRLAVAGKVTAWRDALSGLDRGRLDPYFIYAEARWLRKLLLTGASY